MFFSSVDFVRNLVLGTRAIGLRFALLHRLLLVLYLQYCAMLHSPKYALYMIRCTLAVFLLSLLLFVQHPLYVWHIVSTSSSSQYQDWISQASSSRILRRDYRHESCSSFVIREYGEIARTSFVVDRRALRDQQESL